MEHGTGRGEVYKRFRWGKRTLGRPGIDGRIILRWLFRK
jgi:hypothetical protein